MKPNGTIFSGLATLHNFCSTPSEYIATLYLEDSIIYYINYSDINTKLKTLGLGIVLLASASISSAQANYWNLGSGGYFDCNSGSPFTGTHTKEKRPEFRSLLI